MRLKVRYFASLADITGCAEESLEAEPTADLEQLWELLVDRHPALGELVYRPMVACDLEYSSWEQHLQGVREVALLPPVGGG
jgi:molybdopterin converting factor small subunit